MNSGNKTGAQGFDFILGIFVTQFIPPKITLYLSQEFWQVIIKVAPSRQEFWDFLQTPEARSPPETWLLPFRRPVPLRFYTIVKSTVR
jgi:hypothetical protein